MQIEVIQVNENPLLKRKEVTAKASGFTSTPSAKEVSEALCNSLGAKADSLVVSKIDQRTGRNTVMVSAKLYDSPEAKKAVEKEKKQKAAGEKQAKK